MRNDASAAGSGGALKACRSNADCPAPDADRCDPVLSACVECLIAEDCSPAHDCLAGRCVPFTPCQNSRDCATTQVCNGSLGRCVECVAASDCAAGHVCAHDRCLRACKSDRDCTPIGLLCEPSAGFCVACLRQTDCSPAEHCANSTCVPDVCAPGTSVCAGNAIAACNADGAGFDIAGPCGPGETCVATGDAVACVRDSGTGGAGGASNSGGAGGSGNAGAGGSSGAGGVLGSGAANGSGGVTGTGGAGGVANTGGATNSGGSTNTGGITATGGVVGTGGVGGGPPSCQGLAATCGPSGNESCCTSAAVTGGSYYNYYDGVSTKPADFTKKNYPATVSTFRLDKFEVTVGRFRKFEAAWNAGWRPAAGAGKHAHLNGGSGLYDFYAMSSEPGWIASWTTGMAPLATLSSCNPSQTWTPTVGSNENRPINCVTWYEAYAFCIWDGGFLPSAMELHYASAGGSEQRVYPWSNPPTSTAIDCTRANYSQPVGGYCVGLANFVGLQSPEGDGRYGHADLAGNVREWALDTEGPRMGDCVDCTYLSTSAGSFRRYHGGSYLEAPEYLITVYPGNAGPTYRFPNNGLRCARRP